MEAKGEALQLLEEVQPIGVGHLLAHPLGLVIGGGREGPPQRRGQDGQQPGDQQVVARAESSLTLHLGDRMAQQARQAKAAKSDAAKARVTRPGASAKAFPTIRRKTRGMAATSRETGSAVIGAASAPAMLDIRLIVDCERALAFSLNWGRGVG